jgi:hypothetical protein
LPAPARPSEKECSMRKLLIVLIVLAFAGMQIPASLAQEGTPAATSADVPTLLKRASQGDVCSWPVTVAVNDLNVFYPEGNAAYIVTPYMLAPGQALVVEGAYPFARFSSLVTYYGTAAGGQGLEVLGWMPDIAIAPDPGSVNPISGEASDDPAERRWTVRVTGTAPLDATPAPLGQNVLPAHPEGVEGVVGVLIQRVYLPDDRTDPAAGVGKPTLSLETADGERRPLAACTEEETAGWHQFFNGRIQAIVDVVPPPPVPASADARPEFTRMIFEGLAPNPDAAYLTAPVAWEPGRVVVIRGTAPRSGPGEDVDVRYWSFCSGANTPPYPAASCIPDVDVPLAEDGTYTLVVSQPEDRPANATADNGVAWVAGADPAYPDLIALRHLVPSEAFYDQSGWAVAPEDTAAEAAAIMGPYYPEAVYCDVATFEEGGADACFAADDSATPAG